MIDVTEHIGLVHKVVQKHYMLKPWFTYDKYDDLVQHGMIGLLMAAKKFKPELGCQFSTIAWDYIRGYINTSLKVLVKSPYVSLDAVLTNYESMTLHDIISSGIDEPEQVYEQDITYNIINYINKMPHPEGDMYLLWIVGGYTHDKIAPLFNVNTRRVTTCCQRVTRLLRLEFGGDP